MSARRDIVARVLEQRGDHPGLVYIISAMEICDNRCRFSCLSGPSASPRG
jgi:hypothetical protein